MRTFGPEIISQGIIFTIKVKVPCLKPQSLKLDIHCTYILTSIKIARLHYNQYALYQKIQTLI